MGRLFFLAKDQMTGFWMSRELLLRLISEVNLAHFGLCWQTTQKFFDSLTQKSERPGAS